MAEINQAQIEAIVRQVITGIQGGAAKESAPQAKVEGVSFTSTEYNGRKLIGIYADMNEAIEAAKTIIADMIGE